MNDIKLYASMKATHWRDVAHDDLGELIHINILLLQICGLLTVGQGWIRKLARNVLPHYSNLCHFLLTTIYVLNIAVGQYDAATICEFVSMVCLYYRFLELYRQRNQLADLLGVCRGLWTQLTASQKVIVR